MQKGGRISLAAGGALLALGILHFSGALQPIEDVLRGALLPMIRFVSIAGTGAQGALAGRASVDELERKNQDLEAKLSAVSVDYVKLRALEEENRNLRDLTKFLKSATYDHVGARVIARSTDPRQSTLLIDRGKSDGLEEGMAVIVNEGIYVGKITSLSNRVAEVTLVTDSTSRVSAALAGEKKLTGLLEGRGNQVAKLTLIPQSTDIKTNDLIVTAGTEEKVPPNLVIGVVGDIEGTPTDPFKTATLETYVEGERLDLVVVLRPAALRPE
jgi:rod shape-determining protein MreC